MPAFDDCTDAFVAWVAGRAWVSQRFYIACEDGMEIASADGRYLGPDKDLTWGGTRGWQISDDDLPRLHELCSFHARSLVRDLSLPAQACRASALIRR